MKLNKLNVLIFDDSEASRWIVKKAVLRVLPNVDSIVEVSQLNKAKEALNNHHFDICFIDLKIKDKIQGTELIEPCLEKNVIPVVVTGFNDKETLQQCYDLGCFLVVLKTTTEDYLDSALNVCKQRILENKVEYFLKNHFISDSEKVRYTSQSLFSRKFFGPKLKHICIWGQDADHYFNSMKEYFFTDEDFRVMKSFDLKSDRFKIRSFDQPVAFIGITRQDLGRMDYFFERRSEEDKEQVILIINMQREDYQLLSKSFKFINKIIFDATHVEIPRLFERAGDIVPSFEKELEKKGMSIDDDAKFILENYDLKNGMDDVISVVEELSDRYFKETPVLKKAHLINRQGASFLPETAFDFSPDSFAWEDNIRKLGFKEATRIFKRKLIMFYMNKNGNKVRKTARYLKISPAAVVQLLNNFEDRDEE